MQSSDSETKLAFNSSHPFSDVRVLTFNIRYGTADDRENTWSLRKEFVADVIRNSNSDIIGLQEALDFQIDELLHLRPEFASVGVGREDGARKGEFAPIFYRTNRFKLERQGNFWLSAAPDVPNSITWGNACTRVCTWARLFDKTNPATPAILMFNTHLDHVSELSRELGIRLVIQKMKTIALPTDTVFLTGDFNVDDEDPVISFLTGIKSNSSEQEQRARSTQPDVCVMGGYGAYHCGSVQKIVGMIDRQSRDRYVFRDTYRELHPLPSREDIAQGKLEEATYHAFTGKLVGRRIDFCFMLNPSAEVLSAEILREVRNSRYPSDHYPVLTAVRIPHPER